MAPAIKLLGAIRYENNLICTKAVFIRLLSEFLASFWRNYNSMGGGGYFCVKR